MEERNFMLAVMRDYQQRTVRELLGRIDRNTVLHPAYLTKSYPRAKGEVAMSSVLHRPVSLGEIEAEERSIGIVFPRDIRAYFLVANGAGAVAEGYGFFSERLPRLQDLFWEVDLEYMQHYTFMLLPEFCAIDIDWPPVGRGLAMYKEEPTGSRHLWVLDSHQIAAAKAVLKKAYEEQDAQGRALIEAEIVRYYGSRRALEEMEGYCLYQVWGLRNEERLFPSMRSYLAYLACRSQEP